MRDYTPSTFRIRSRARLAAWIERFLYVPAGTRKAAAARCGISVQLFDFLRAKQRSRLEPETFWGLRRGALYYAEKPEEQLRVLEIHALVDWPHRGRTHRPQSQGRIVTLPPVDPKRPSRLTGPQRYRLEGGQRNGGKRGLAELPDGVWVPVTALDAKHDFIVQQVKGQWWAIRV